MDEALTTDEDDTPSLVESGVIERLRAERRLQCAQRLHQRRGRVGAVLDVEDAAEEVERLHALLSARQHPHMIWDESPGEAGQQG